MESLSNRRSRRTSNEQAVVATIDPAKDVDGFSSAQRRQLVRTTLPALSLPRRWVAYASCKKRRHDSAQIAVGGRPQHDRWKTLALLLNATREGRRRDSDRRPFTSRELARNHTGRDIVIAAIGRPHFLGAKSHGDNAWSSNVGHQP